MSSVAASEVKRSKVEQIKEQSHFLRDPLLEELAEDTTHFSEAAVQVLKFHGTYQQDDRDTRQQRRQEGRERDYSMMLRTRIPGGHVPPQLYLTLDRLADQYGNGTLRATTRQTFQLHGILKKNLKATLASILHQMGSTLAACGDVNRNVMAPVAPYKNRPAYRYAQEYARKLADLLAPKTSAYYEIWVDGEPIPIPPVDEDVLVAQEFVGHGVRLEGPEPLYGPVYLPRKFKTAITVAGENTVDVYSQDLGLIVLTDRKGSLKGFNIVVGGGMGRTHGKEETEPLLAQKLCFAPPESVHQICQAILAVQRDHGNRSDRKQARLKYLVRKWGIRKFRRVVEEY
ncbi:MAG: NADPH-dependent assimilatory sulfite reductase hemoprotein subunit, partial [Cyanobacteriota bacterium]